MSTLNKPSTAMVAVAAALGGVCAAIGLWGMHLSLLWGISAQTRGIVGYVGMALLSGASLGYVARLDVRR